LNTAGLIDDYDVLRLEVELANLEPNLRRARNAVLRERRELAIQVNLPDHETLEVRGALAEMDLTDFSSNTPANQEILLFNGMNLGSLDGQGATIDDALARVGEMRSDLRQLELSEELRHTEMRAEQANYLPEITVFGSYIITAQDNGSPSFFGRGDGQRADSKAFGLRVSLPIFQGFRRDARIDQKRAALRQAQAMTSLGIEVAESQVRTIVDEVEESYLRATSQRLAVRQAQRGFEIASAKFSEGLGSRLELTDAEVALRQSEFNYAQAVFDYLVARAQLDEAVGKVPLVDTQIDVAGDDR
jgi:outer membrane protein TolC